MIVFVSVAGEIILMHYSCLISESRTTTKKIKRSLVPLSGEIMLKNSVFQQQYDASDELEQEVSSKLIMVCRLELMSVLRV